MQRVAIALVLTLLLASVGPAQAQTVVPAGHEHHQDHAALGVGAVNFPVSCDPAVQADFDRAVALLHSFWWLPVREAFGSIAARDPSCAMAHWGLALGWWENPIAGPPSPERLRNGAAAVERALALGARTERERGYVAAVEALYKDYATASHRDRIVAYERAMERLSRENPADREAAIFYGLALNISALPTDKNYTNQRKAAEVLEKAFAADPTHPGVAHYLIHTYDYPALSAEGVPFARTYTGLAPAVPHARHMPSHTFTRVGLWRDSIASNRASAEVAEGGDWIHAQDYLVYAHLQLGQDAAARSVLDRVLAARFPGPAGNLAAGVANATVPARFAYERARWGDAAALIPRDPPALAWDRVPQAEAVTHLARAIGAARTGDLATAHGAVARLDELHGALLGMRDAYWATQVEVWRDEASGWIAHAEGDDERALQLLRAAADLEATTDKHAVWPGALAPAREMLGDLLLLTGRPGQALAEYEASMANEPNRLRGLHGAARAAELAGEAARARTYYNRLLVQLSGADSERAEVADASGFLARSGRAAGVLLGTGRLRAGSGGHTTQFTISYPGNDVVYSIGLTVWPDDGGVLRNAGFRVYDAQGGLQLTGGTQPGLDPNVSADLIRKERGVYVVQVYNYNETVPVEYTLRLARPAR